jgi:hypothetical protein
LHQLKKDFSKDNQYERISPCLLLVSANQHVDNIASIGIGTIHSNSYQDMVKTQPKDYSVGVGLRFYLTHDTKRLDKETSKEIKKAAVNEIFGQAGTKPSQGLISRILNYAIVSCQVTGTRGPSRLLICHQASLHTWSFYKSPLYQKYSQEHTAKILCDNGHPVPNLYTDSNKLDPRYLQCPFCLEVLGGSETVGKGNIHHYHLFCGEASVHNTIEQVCDFLENSIGNLWQEIQGMLGHSRAQKALQNWTNLLQELELKAAKTMSKQCTKEASRSRNISIIASNAPDPPTHFQYTNAKSRWPLCVALGFITARKECEFNDATSSAVNMAHLGVIPDKVHDWIAKTIKQAVSTQEAPKLTATLMIKELTRKWTRITALAWMRAHCLQK